MSHKIIFTCDICGKKVESVNSTHEPDIEFFKKTTQGKVYDNSTQIVIKIQSSFVDHDGDCAEIRSADICKKCWEKFDKALEKVK